MTGLTIFLIGTVLVSNISILAYLLLDCKKNTTAKSPANTSEPPVKETVPPPEPSDTGESDQSIVGTSHFIMEEFEAKFNKVEEKLVALGNKIDRLEGDVSLNDVEFADTDDNPTADTLAKEEAETEKFVPKKFFRMSPEEEANAFNDVRIEEFEPDMVSAPSASGVSMEEIEHSVDTAMNPTASIAERAKADKILNDLIGTDLMDRLTSVDDIYKGVMRCLRENYRAEIGVTDTPKSAKKPSKKRENFNIPDNIDDFNPADLLRK